MRSVVVWLLVLGWMGALGGRAVAQGESVVGVMDQPMQIFLHPVTVEGVRADLGADAETASFLLEVVRSTYQADLARVLTQHVAPTRVIEGKTRPSAPGWEMTARMTEVRWPGPEGRLGVATTLEVVDLRSGRTLMTLNVRSGLDEGVALLAVEDDDAVTPWNPPPPRLKHPKVSEEVCDAVQTETTLAVRRAVHRLLGNIRKSR